MNDIFTVMKFTMKDMLKRKSFIISTIIILVMIVIGFNIPNLMKSIKSGNENLEKEKVLVVDTDNIYEDKLKNLELENLEIILSDDSIDKIKEKILNKEIDSGVIINKTDESIKMTYIVENVMFMDEAPTYISDVLQEVYKNIQLDKLKLTDAQKLSINPIFEYDMVQAETEAKGNIFAMMMMSIVLFYAVYFCAFQVSSSITTEKTSKIIETLVTSTSPKNIVLGKTLGIGIVGLLQLGLIILTALISAKVFISGDMLSQILDVSTLNASLFLITLLYFLLGYFVYALLYAMTGSTVSKPEDIQSANGPIALITVMGFYLAYFTMMNPSSNLNMLAGLIPISSPFCMPFRIMMGLSTPLEVISSILILIVTIIIVANITIKIYSNAILNYGTKLSIKEIIKMYKQK